MTETRAAFDDIAASLKELKIIAAHLTELALKKPTRGPRKPKTPEEMKTKTAQDGGGVKKPRKPKNPDDPDKPKKPRKPKKAKAVADAPPVPTPSEADDD